MKKNYAMPHTKVVAIECVTMQVTSPNGVNSDKGIGYAGVDTEGTVEPGARRRRDVWADEEEEAY